MASKAVTTKRPNTPNITLEDCRILFRNFAGVEKKYNRAGDRNFVVVIPPEIHDQVVQDGWNVKYLAPREEDEAPTPYIQVAVNFNGPRPPRVVMITSRGRTTLPEEMVEILDWAMIKQTDLIVRPYHWEVNGNTGVKAYLQSIYITIEEDELEKKYAEVPEIGTGVEQNALDYRAEPLQIESSDYDKDIIEGEIVED